MFRKLCDRDGTPMVSLDKGELRLDGIVDADGEIPEDQKMYVNRVAEGAYLVRAVDGDDIPEVGDAL
ncbi:hypothetical protein SAMN06269185_1183 [Natronoarchaeum philippinense]|uniref:DUF8053 domain-containing protein n=1 Tax=Natronoarchaeum philippinense TaxID=558529 RepID=A0A285NAF9_NATPI|nr:hypothetical protein [Natronoarchaeum philippinense]SNZ06474.1 hypothetical protein SAMN06269185_1183 [Natronoarchaeum philippinense]